MLKFLFITAALAPRHTSGFIPAKPPSIQRDKPFTRLSVIKIANAEGCAAVPFEKKKIAVFGAGGYLGAVVFGFLQRASTLYGTGIAGGSSPRAIGATRTTSEALNKVLTPCFKLAYAGEDLVRLVDTTNKDYITDRLKSFDAAVLGTVYQLESRTVTGNTYEKTPNDKTFDFYLDERYGVNEAGVPADDSEYHLQMFETTVHACKDSGSIHHLVVLETPRTKRPVEFINILERENMPYTYIRAKHFKKDKTYSFEKGVKDKLNIKLLHKGTTALSEDQPKEDDALYREDLAALIVQSLMSLNWKKSRILEVSAAESIVSEAPSKKQKFDKEWCPNSQVYAEMLASLT
ncbi:hypothetical protein ACHAWO_007582 [Cyclotella atomus]|uniref:Uncharacterized protein n=1 Tax=Cyclotella atomus TaxID=382360 RepID=A0ABD3MPG6_9STRA